ncbi:uncharacterized protein [Nicotiana sylvestris]|uniref:uncharacterized protein n=1 Tax=Nicotiana sylvestris TaxID=4096 RepID=UPI00388C956F
MLFQPGLRLSHLTPLSQVLFQFVVEMLQFYLIWVLLIPTCHPILLHIWVSTPVGYAIVVDRVYRSCVVTIWNLETNIYLLLFDMVDFDVILGMDWLSTYHAILDCHAKTVALSLPGLPRLEWRRTPGHSTSRVISYMKARRMVEKRCLAYLAYARNSSAEVSSMDLVPVFREFPEVFPADLRGMPPNMDIDFCIDLAPSTQAISILPYHMAPPELKKLKEKLQDLLD